MDSLESELERARDLSVGNLADAIESIGFECTRCGACCRAAEDGNGDSEPHTATVFPDEIREIAEREGYDWRDVARPMPYGLSGETESPEGTTFEWALQTDDCGDCKFYDDGDSATPGTCRIYDDRPLICRTYPFSVALEGSSQPLGEAVDRAGIVRAHECDGLGREISRERAESLATALKERAIREIEEAIAVRERYEPVERDEGEIVVYDSEGPKRADGTPR